MAELINCTNCTNCICTSKNVLNKSKSCLDYSNDSNKFDCHPLHEDNAILGIIVGVWFILNAIIGTVGNSLTILSLFYAAKRKL